MKRIICYIILIIGLFTWSGCTEEVALEKETDTRAYRRGKSLLREGRKDEALEAFLAVIAARPDAAESHLEAGLLYLNHIKDPLGSIYHFRQYLALKPDAEYSEFVKELVLTAKKEFAASLPGKPFAEEVQRVDLMEKLKEQERLNLQLKEELATARQTVVQGERELQIYRNQLQQIQTQQGSGNNQVSPIVINSAPSQSSGNGAGNSQNTPSVYTVETGDTLSRISQKVYGTSGKWMDIFQANRDILPSPNSLKPGQELRIP